MNESLAMEVAEAVAKKYGRSEQTREDLLSVALLGICEEFAKRQPLSNERGLMYVAAKNAVIDEKRAEKYGSRSSRRRPVVSTVSIHYAVTETIEEWKRAPDQEDVTLVSEVRRKARAACTPPQLEVIMRRAASHPHRAVGMALRMGVATVCAHEKAGLERLAAAVRDDD